MIKSSHIEGDNYLRFFRPLKQSKTPTFIFAPILHFFCSSNDQNRANTPTIFARFSRRYTQFVRALYTTYTNVSSIFIRDFKPITTQMQKPRLFENITWMTWREKAPCHDLAENLPKNSSRAHIITRLQH